MRTVVLIPLVALALIVSPAALANVQLINVTSPVRPGAYASISVTTHTIAHCSIRVHYKTRPALTTPGLSAKGTLFGGIVQWRWRMPAGATLGRWSIDVICGSSGTLHTSFLVQ